MRVLTFVDDLAKEIFPSEKVPRRAVPSPLAKLKLALGDGLIRSPRHSH